MKKTKKKTKKKDREIEQPHDIKPSYMEIIADEIGNNDTRKMSKKTMREVSKASKRPYNPGSEQLEFISKRILSSETTLRNLMNMCDKLVINCDEYKEIYYDLAVSDKYDPKGSNKLLIDECLGRVYELRVKLNGCYTEDD